MLGTLAKKNAVSKLTLLKIGLTLLVIKEM